jgi:hypothetical protein
MGVPTVEKAPGIHEPWLGIWRYALLDLKANGLWSPSRRPWLDAYVEALRTAAEHRAIAESAVETIHHRARDGEPAWDEELPPGVQRNRESGMDHLHAGFGSADKELRRAMLLAEALGLTPKAQKALATKAEEAPSALTSILDELAPRRAAKSDSR